MNFDLYSAAAGGVILWLVGWVSKHVLDRLFLPRVVDWWARRNSKRAIARAVRLLKSYNLEFLLSSDLRHLFLYALRTILFAFAYTGMTLVVVVSLTARVAVDTDIQYTGKLMYLSYIWFAGVFAFLVFARLLTWRVGNVIAILANPETHYEQVLRRMKSLLEAGGLNKEQILEWLKQVPRPEDKL